MSEEGLNIITDDPVPNEMEIEKPLGSRMPDAIHKSLKTARVQSPSSIITYRQCPRKYYYQYIENLPTKPSIHTIRGKIVHSVLEDFFQLPLIQANDYRQRLQFHILNLFSNHWVRNEAAIRKLNINDEALQELKEESALMLIGWLSNFVNKVEAEIRGGLKFIEAFRKYRPRTEHELVSETLGLHGFIDAIESFDDKTRLMDYKTSKKFDISDEYRLQLALYALLYTERHNKTPDSVGIYFLNGARGGEKTINVDEELLSLARFEVEQIHASTTTRDKLDYNRKPGPLCKWATGQCDFYEVCRPFENQNERL